MALRDLLNLVSQVSVIKETLTPDGMGGQVATTSTSIIPLAALWLNSSRNWYVAGQYAKDSTHTLVFEYGAYTFGVPVSSATIVETISYNGEEYNTVGFCDDVMGLHEICVQNLSRTE